MITSLYRFTTSIRRLTTHHALFMKRCRMDPLEFQVVWLGQPPRPYRIPPTGQRQEQPKQPASAPQPLASPAINYEEEVQEVAEVLEEEHVDEKLFESVKQKGNDYWIKFSCDPLLFPHLIGRQGTNKHRVEQETCASLMFPNRDTSNAQASDVMVTGSSQRAVALAYTRLKTQVANVLAGKGPSSPDYNYFISLPLSHQTIQSGVKAFQQQAKELYAGEIDSSMYNRPETLHLTLLMLKLYSEEARVAAKKVLQGLDKAINDSLLLGKPLQVHLRGLAVMNDNPQNANVLYAKVVDDGNRISRLCDVVIKAFSEAGLLIPNQDTTPVKLHATLLNTRLAKRNNSSNTSSSRGSQAASTVSGGGDRRRVGLDLRRMMDLDFDLGRHVIASVHLSQRHSYDHSGYYTCAAELKLPA